MSALQVLLLIMGTPIGFVGLYDFQTSVEQWFANRHSQD